MFRAAVSTRDIDGLALRLARRSDDMSEAMTEIAGIMLDAVEENFEQEGRPEKWLELAEVTKDDRERTGNLAASVQADSSDREAVVSGFGREHPILQRTGNLAASVQADSSDREAVVSTNLRYAALQHFGGEAGRGKKVKIPPRPFLVLAPEDEDEIVGVLRRLIEKDLRAP